MAVTAFAAGSQLAVINTEHFVADINLEGLYTFNIEVVNMAAGDGTEFRVYRMPQTLGTPRIVWAKYLTGLQPFNAREIVSLPIGNQLSDATSLRFSIKQIFGTGRNYFWEALRYV